MMGWLGVGAGLGCLTAMASGSGENGGNGPGTGVITKVKPRTKKPAMYKVVLLNDDFTPMNFVVKIWEEVFHKDHEESLAIMLEVHHFGRGIAGIYSKEIADTKVDEAMNLAALNEFPLRVIAEPDSSDSGDAGS